MWSDSLPESDSLRISKGQVGRLIFHVLLLLMASQRLRQISWRNTKESPMINKRKSFYPVSPLSRIIETEETPLTSSATVKVESEGANSGRPNVQVSSKIQSKEEHLTRGAARVTYSARIRRITLQRYLVSRIVFEVEEVSFMEILVLYDNILWCEEKARKDPGFRQKFGGDLSILAKILKETRFSLVSFSQTIKVLSEKCRNQLENFIFPRRNLPGVRIHVLGKFHVLPYRESGVPRSQLPPKPYIGIGYKDKGSRRDPAYDASPSWQEVVNLRIFQ